MLNKTMIGTKSADIVLVGGCCQRCELKVLYTNNGITPRCYCFLCSRVFHVYVGHSNIIEYAQRGKRKDWLPLQKEIIKHWELRFNFSNSELNLYIFL